MAALVVAARIDDTRRWYTIPDAAPVIVTVIRDPTATRPTIRFRSGAAEVPLTPRGTGFQIEWGASLDLRAAKPGTYLVDVIERVAIP